MPSRPSPRPRPQRRNRPRRDLPPLPHGLKIVLLPDGYRWTCFLCDSQGKKSYPLQGVARTGARHHHCETLGRAAVSLRSFLRTDQEWVDHWKARPDMFLQLVKAFERSVAHYPDPQKALDYLNTSHRVPRQRGSLVQSD